MSTNAASAPGTAKDSLRFMTLTSLSAAAKSGWRVQTLAGGQRETFEPAHGRSGQALRASDIGRHELGGVEFKGPGPVSNGRLAAQVVKAILGMSNRRDGGKVIIGVEDNQGALNPVGLSESDLAGWNYDAVADQVARYADPGATFTLEVNEYDGNGYIVLVVEESRVPGSGVIRGRGSGERETTASSLAGKEESSRKEDNSGQGKDGPAGAIAQGGNGR